MRPYPLARGLRARSCSPRSRSASPARRGTAQWPRVRAAAGARRRRCASSPGAVAFPAGDRPHRHAAPSCRSCSRSCSAQSSQRRSPSAVGVGALRVRGLLLAISTMAFAIAAEEYIFPRPIFVGTEGSTLGEVDRGQARSGRPDAPQPRTTTSSCSAPSSSCSLLVGHLRRTGIGRAIIGVRENEAGAAGAHGLADAREAHRVRARRVHRRARRRRARRPRSRRSGSPSAFFRVDDSLTTRADRGDRRARQPRGRGHRRVVGRRPPAFWPKNQTRAAAHVEHRPADRPAVHPGRLHADRATALRGVILRWLEKRLPERAGEDRAPRRRSRCRDARPPRPPTNDDGSVLAHDRRSRVDFGGLVAVDDVDFHAMPGEVIGLIGTNGAGKSTLLNAIGGYVPSHGQVELLGNDVSRLAPHLRAPRRPRPHVPGRDAVPRAHRARDRAARARGARPHVVLGLAALRAAVDRQGAHEARPRPPSSSTSSVSAATPTGSSPSCRPARAASSSSRRCSRSRPA